MNWNEEFTIPSTQQENLVKADVLDTFIIYDRGKGLQEQDDTQ